jgi:hypothetical protein
MKVRWTLVVDADTDAARSFSDVVSIDDEVRESKRFLDHLSKLVGLQVREKLDEELLGITIRDSLEDRNWLKRGLPVPDYAKGLRENERLREGETKF